MSLLDVNVSEAQEPKVVPQDEEYQLRILDVRVDIDKNGDPYMQPRFEVVGEPLAKDFTHFVRIPHDGLDEKAMVRAQWALKTFLETFGLATQGQLDSEDLKGQTGWAILGVKEDETYGEQNFVRKFVAPKA